MPLKQFKFTPGINRDQTNYANEGGWWAADKVRFLSGYPQKLGGWVRYTTTIYRGVCRAMYNWAVQGGYNLLALGTNSKVYVESGGTLHDITPIRQTFGPGEANNCFTTLNFPSTPKIVLVTITNHGAGVGDFVTFSGVVGPIGGVPQSDFNKEFEVLTVPTGNTFTIAVTTDATSTVTGGGTEITAAFQLSSGYGTAVGGYGWGAPPWGGNSTPPTGWGIAGYTPIYRQIRLQYFDNFNRDLIYNIRGGDIYYWEFDPNLEERSVLLSSKTVPYVPAVNNVIQNAVEVYAYGDVGTVFVRAQGASPPAYPRAVVGFGEVGTVVTSGTTTIVSGVNTSATIGTVVVVAVSAALSVPRKVTQILTDDANNFVLAFGCTPFGDENGDANPLLIRWCSQGDVLNWAPNVDIGISTAGYLEIQSGSGIVQAVQNYGEILVFTSSSLTSIQFVGPASPVYGSSSVATYTQKLVSADISVIGPRAILANNNILYWMGVDKFYIYNGRVETLPCTLRQHVFDNINYAQTDQITCGANQKYNEIWWFYCSASSFEIDSYVIFNYVENIWYYGTCSDNMVRTAWLDSSLRQYPQAAGGLDSYIYNHEIGHDADDLPFTSYIESSNVDVEDGDQFVLLRRIIPDVTFDGSTPAPGVNPSVDFTVMSRNFPGSNYADTNAEGQEPSRAIVRTTTVPVEQYTHQVFVRVRSRQMALRIESSAILGVSWQLGNPRFDLRLDGRRA